jgi:hypothetical protein
LLGRSKELPIEVRVGGDAFPKGAQLIDASFGRVASKGDTPKRKKSIP